MVDKKCKQILKLCSTSRDCRDTNYYLSEDVINDILALPGEKVDLAFGNLALAPNLEITPFQIRSPR